MKKQPNDIARLNKKIDDFAKSHQEKVSSLTNGGIFAKALALGSEFFGATLVGCAIGVLADRVFGSKFVFLIIFGLCGCAAGVLNMYRFAKKLDEEIKR